MSEAEKTLQLDVRKYPHNWSAFASAILKTIKEDKKKGRRVVMSKSWYEDLLSLSTRFVGVVGVGEN